MLEKNAYLRYANVTADAASRFVGTITFLEWCPMLRSIIPRCRDDEAFIDRFQCSSCAWVYRFENPQTFLVDEQDGLRACRAFELHECTNYQMRTA